jgi:SpoVK/Ycf46/Vps4 family AAA+-type ATPase
MAETVPTSTKLDELRKLVQGELTKSGISIEERRKVQDLLNFVNNLEQQSQSLPSFKDQLLTLEEKVKALEAPPLEYGIVLGNPPLTGVSIEGENYDQRDLVIGVRGQRLEVKLGNNSFDPTQLQEGQEVLVNKNSNVVGVRSQYVRGETAEVINIIFPSGTAQVSTIDEEAEKLVVRWSEGKKFEVTCERSLSRSLYRGAIVRIDEDSNRAVEKIKPRLHVRCGNSDGIVVEISDRLFQQGVEIGDLVRIDTRLLFAFEKLPSYETGGLALEDVPNVTYDEVGGLNEQIETIRDAIELPYIHRHLFEEYQLARPKGILLYGPPGCGKTMIAKAIANSLTQGIREHLQTLERRIHQYKDLKQKSYLSPSEERTNDSDSQLQQLVDELQRDDVDLDNLDAELIDIQSVLQREDGIRSFFLNIKGPELLNKWVGETEHRIRKIFEEAKRRASFYTPVIIFFDEMEAMFRARGSGRSSDVETTIVPQFLSEMDGVEATENVVIIGASNLQNLIDPAILRPGRLDVKIKIDRPNAEASRAILALHLTPDLPLNPQGLKRPIPPEMASIVQTVVFKPQPVKRTLQKLGKSIPSDLLEQIFADIPDHCDVRKAVFQSQLNTELSQQPSVQELLLRIAQQEQLAEILITEVVDILFSSANRLEATTGSGKSHIFRLFQFVSGAILVSIVSRAKRAALKQQVADHQKSVAGIAIADLRAAIKEEFEENKLQLVSHQLQQELEATPTALPDKVQSVELCLEEDLPDPWNLEKVTIDELRAGLPLATVTIR